MSLPSLMAACAIALLTAAPVLAADCTLSPVAQEGKMVSNQCKSCHVFEADKPSPNTAPNLHDVYGYMAGTRKDFAHYSAAMAAASAKGLIWTDDTLFAYLADPKIMLQTVTGDPSLKHGMFFSLRDPDQRKAVIAFLKAIKDKPACN